MSYIAEGGRSCRTPLAAAFLLAALACQSSSATEPEPSGGATAPSPTPVTGDKKVTVDRITYASPDGNLFTVNPDGSGQQKLTGTSQVEQGTAGRFLAQPIGKNELYAWPTWSPDGTKLAASHVQLVDEQSEVTVQVFDLSTGQSTTVYENELTALVADGAPHYLYWSPDSIHLGFLAVTRGGLTLFVVNTESQESAVAVQSGAPMYYQWSSDGSSLVIHIAEELKLAQAPFSDNGETLVESTLGFRAPALSSEGGRFAYVGAGDSSGSLYIAEATAPAQGWKVLDVGTLSAFVWSPGGQELAVVDRDSPTSPIFQRLRVVPGEGGQERTIGEGQIMAYYWSPNGENIAWVSVDHRGREFVWRVGPRTGDSSRELFRFIPSSDTLIMLSFFDQYGYSHSPWSPDGTRLVVAGTQGRPLGSTNGQTPSGDRVFILDASGNAPPQELAAGTLAFWSWN